MSEQWWDDLPDWSLVMGPRGEVVRRSSGAPSGFTFGFSPDSDFNVLIVVSQYSWLAREFALTRTVRVVSDLGLDAPDLSGFPDVRAGWWVPGEHAVRLRRAGLDLPLQSLPQGWLSTVDRQWTKRAIWSGTLQRYLEGDGPRAGWSKISEAKVSRFPATWRQRSGVARDAESARINAHSIIEICPELLTLSCEHRLFVVDGTVVASSPYLDSDGCSWEEDWHKRTDMRSDEAVAFGQQLASALPLPNGVVLDVAWERERGWLLLEGNPAWASNPYGADPEGAVACVLAANRRSDRWNWNPDATLCDAAARKRPLRVSPPLWLLKAWEDPALGNSPGMSPHTVIHVPVTDVEPPVGSLVIRFGVVWVREEDGWTPCLMRFFSTWRDLRPNVTRILRWGK